MSKQEQLQEILYEMFQMGNSDLDFGIYRIMNIKNSEITQFFDKKLFDGELSLTDEAIIYSNMVEFFSRYYQNGDFVSQRRYTSGSTYAIPYNGEEVKLHWANADQYYIKTSEDFKDYTFKTPYATVSFKIKEAETDSNNNKSEKRFFVFTDLIEEENHLVLNFDYKPVSRKGQKLQDKINSESFEAIREKIDLSKYGVSQIDYYGKDNKKTRTLLEKHLTRYTAKNSFDYFIHKDLGKFLRQELDNFIKSELINLNDILESTDKVKQTKFERIKVFKDLSLDVIAFLAQLEDFQKKLWEKKKFIIETNYCITLDKIDEQYYEQIFTTQKALQDEQIELLDHQKKNQLDEWKTLFDVDVQSVNDLKSEKYLVLDTKFFDTGFKYKLLSKLDNLDEEIDGVLISSENFGALNLLQKRYKEQIQTVYIDPPYNTGNDGFIYSDNFQHSSWMSFMYDRLTLGRDLMSDDGIQFSSIDDNEFINLKSLNNLIFQENNFMGNVVRATGQTTGQDSDGLGSSFDFLLLNSKSENGVLNGLPLTEKDLKRFENKDEKGFYAYDQMRKTGSGDKREDRLNMYYPIKDPDGNNLYPIAPAGYKGRWRFKEPTYKQLLQDNYILWKKSKRGDEEIWWPYVKYYLEGRTKRPSPLWDDIEGNKKASRDLRNLFADKLFDFPKPLEMIERCILIAPDTKDNGYILDYFAGSGTTGHSVINLNREDNGKRKYILVEMGEYFDSVTKPRIQKVIYTKNWKDGKPQDKEGISQLFKYFKLESYEDTLNNLTVKTKVIPSLYQNEYLLHYILDDETKESQLDIDKFKTPFDYKLQISSGIVGETKEVNIDLVETFNYLIGLQIKSIKSEEGLIIIKGATLHNEKIMVIWRDNEAKVSSELQKEFTEYDKVYINGDVDIDAENIYLIEKTFYEQMFKGV